jgi:hypothetical protein
VAAVAELIGPDCGIATKRLIRMLRLRTKTLLMKILLNQIIWTKFYYRVANEEE